MKINKDEAVQLLLSSFKADVDERLLEMARSIIEKFYDTPPPEDQSFSLQLNFELSTNLLFEIDKHIKSKANGRKKRKKLLENRFKLRKNK